MKLAINESAQYFTQVLEDLKYLKNLEILNADIVNSCQEFYSGNIPAIYRLQYTGGGRN